MTSEPAPARGTGSRVRRMLPLVAEMAEAAERAGRIDSHVLQAMISADLFRLCVPRSLGGGEVPPAVVLDAVEEVASADAGTAWSLMIGATTAVVSGYLPAEVAKEVYDAPTSVTVGPFAPLGRARRDGGGHRLTGRWPYVSMCRDSSWIVAGGLDEESRRLLFLFPTASAQVHDTWHVMGLRSSGSHDIEVTEEFIPPGRALSLGFEQPVAAGALYRFPVLGLLAAAIASVAVGTARAAINDLIDLAGAKTPTYSVRLLGERPLIQLQVAQAQGELGAARAFLRDAVAAAWGEARRGAGVDLARRMTLRLAAAHATAASAKVVDLMYTAGGGSSVYLRSPLQRRFRDVHAATQHVLVGAGVVEQAGRVLLGLKVDPTQL